MNEPGPALNGLDCGKISISIIVNVNVNNGGSKWGIREKVTSFVSLGFILGPIVKACICICEFAHMAPQYWGAILKYVKSYMKIDHFSKRPGRKINPCREEIL